MIIIVRIYNYQTVCLSILANFIAQLLPLKYFDMKIYDCTQFTRKHKYEIESPILHLYSILKSKLLCHRMN